MGKEICYGLAHVEVLLGENMKKRKVKVDGEEYDVELEKQGSVWNVSIEGEIFNIEIEGGFVGESSGSKRKKRGRRNKSGTISSTIPGKIISISVEEGDNVGEIFIENKDSIVITQYYPFLDKDYPQIIFVTHIDKLETAFSMSGLKYPNPTQSISGKCKIIN